MSRRPDKYIGIDKEIYGGMTMIGKIIRDAWVFGLIEETQTCEGWNFAGIDALLDKVNKEWDKYGCLFSHLPPELRERHERIHGAAITAAKAAGWSGELETGDEV
ncbi:MAG: hypothetical protein COB30_000575 [Ectothiorhodospiraceae bacterium]|nr:hypothetical protein [Ectothiorhodospiraceae bacterium]